MSTSPERPSPDNGPHADGNPRQRLYNIRIDAFLFALSLFLTFMAIHSWTGENLFDLRFDILAVAALALFLFSASRLLGFPLGCAIALAIIICTPTVLLIGTCARMKL